MLVCVPVLTESSGDLVRLRSEMGGLKEEFGVTPPRPLCGWEVALRPEAELE